LGRQPNPLKPKYGLNGAPKALVKLPGFPVKLGGVGELHATVQIVTVTVLLRTKREPRLRVLGSFLVVFRALGKRESVPPFF
jgi:hypothetical protein